MGDVYRKELDRITSTHGVARSRPSAPTDPAAMAAFPIGAMVRIVTDGPMHDVIGEVEATFLTRSQVRVGDELYAVPNEVLVSAERLAS